MTNFKAKIIIKGKIELLSGMHIGSGDKDSGIGEVASVIKDPKTGQPIIPGSSLKGKMRSTLELLSDKPDDKVHSCNKETCEVCRLFGSSEKNSKLKTKLIVRDCILENAGEIKNWETSLLYTEIKAENNISRLTVKATPRFTERVPAGAKFNFEMVYTYNSENEELKKDFENIQATLKYIQDDYLGGNGSRGYGKVKFSIVEPEIRCINYYVNPDKINENGDICNEAKNAVEIIKKINQEAK